MNKVNVENLLGFIKYDVAPIAVKLLEAPATTPSITDNAELDSIYNSINAISATQGKGKAFNIGLCVSLVCSIMSLALIFIGNKSASASMSPDPKLLIIGVIILIASLIAFLAILFVKKKNLVKERDSIIDNLETFVLNEIKDILDKNSGKDFNDIDDDSKTRLVKLSFLYGVVYELCRETNVYGSDDINGPYTRPKGFEAQYEGLDRRVQYLVSMIDGVQAKLRNEHEFENNNNRKFLTCGLSSVANTYQAQFNQDVFNGIKSETTGIKFKKDGQPDIELTPGRSLDIFASFCKKVPVLKLFV